MGERKIDPRLQKIYDEGIEVFSISKLDTINNCLLEAYKQYKEHDRGENNIYGYAGTKIHDVLEAIMNNKATEADLLPAMQQELEELELIGIEFPKDRNGEDTIRDSWVKDMEHFCKTYKKPKDDVKNFSTEEFFIYKTTKGHYVQGYIDLIHKNKDGTISIYDYKTSSLYSGEAVKEHARQLLTYAMAKQQEGFNVKSISWIFLKYCEVRFMGKKTVKSKNKTEISKVIERRKIPTEMAKYVLDDLIEVGVDELEANSLITAFKRTGIFPKIVQNNYKVLPYVMEYEITPEALQETEDYINNTIEKWQALGNNIENFPHRKFTKIQKNGKEVGDYFYCTVLCNHKMCADVVNFMDQWEQINQEDEDMFG